MEESPIDTESRTSSPIYYSYYMVNAIMEDEEHSNEPSKRIEDQPKSSEMEKYKKLFYHSSFLITLTTRPVFKREHRASSFLNCCHCCHCCCCGKRLENLSICRRTFNFLSYI